MSRQALEKDTGKLFGDLWGPYDEKLFEESVELFTKRLDLMGFDKSWFKGKTCLDAGCGGGRNTIAMARLGADHAYGIDLGEKGIADAKQRSKDLSNTHFQTSSILDIPFEDEKFDMVWCAGVLMIVDDEEAALSELARVVKKGGKLYLLVYATGGLRWPLIQVLRPIAEQLGQEEIESVMEAISMPANKRRTFLDDLFCPKLDFYHWDRLQRMLEKRGFKTIERIGENARLDHEHSLQDYRIDLESLLTVFAKDKGVLYEQAYNATKACIDTIVWFEKEVASKKMTEKEAMTIVIGQGHHRVLSTKG